MFGGGKNHRSDAAALFNRKGGNPLSQRRIVIAGTGSGVGKTTVTLGIMSALQKKGLTVQGFKCGPDYIDTSYHTAVTKRDSRNLDSWMLDEDTLRDVFSHGSKGVDISVIEGVMGFFDGKDPRTNAGSTAEISMLTKSPVLLIVDCAAMARSAAAIVKGFQTLAAGSTIVGVIANKVGSEGHFQLVKTAVEQECGIPVIGYLRQELDIKMPERRLGLIPAIERGELDEFFDQLGELVLKTVDIEKLLALSKVESLPLRAAANSLFSQKKKPFVRIAVAKDAAFHAYYSENLEMLQACGAELTYFSPLSNEGVPKHSDGIYLGGGFAEEFAPVLAQNERAKQSLKEAIEQGVPTLAECGGFMLLCESLEATDQTKHAMIGIIPGKVKMHPHITAIGYREIRGRDQNFLLGEGERARGHEFHYATFHCDYELPYAFEMTGMREARQEGYLKSNLIAGFTQIHFASCPSLVKNWIDKCAEFSQTF